MAETSSDIQIESQVERYLDSLPETCKYQGVCHTVAFAVYIKKYLKTKRRIMKTQMFHHPCKNRIFQKSSQKNRPIIIIQGPKSLKLLYSIMNLNTISLPQQQARPTNKTIESPTDRNKSAQKHYTHLTWLIHTT